MKVLVTGASGFIGRNLLPMIVKHGEQNKVFAVARRIPKEVHPAINWIAADLGIPDWTKNLPDEDFNAVIHLAQSKHYREFPEQAIDIFNINVRATVELSEWALKHHVKRFLFASTGNVYGSKDLAHREEDPCNPETMYGASKLSAEILLKPFSQFMDILVIRLFGVYGPGQTDAILPGLIEKFITGDEITIASNIGVKFNPIFVSDCSTAIHRLITTHVFKGYKLLNIGGSEVIDLGQIVSLLERMGSQKALTRITSDSPKQLVGSIDRLKQQIGFEETVPFEEGLRLTYNFLKSAVERVQ